MSRRRAALAAAVFAGAVSLYLPTLTHGFVNWDDPVYVTENPAVMKGLTGRGVAWAFTTGLTGNWHPLTWVSHMADTSLFGQGAPARHGVNALLHGLVALLLFLLLSSWTGQDFRAAIVAALFACHPLHVESVAWIAERKDLLCAAFELGALSAWTAWTRRGTAALYAASLLLFAMALASKPMAVTMPFLLLLLDVWPLGRLEWPPARGQVRARLLEKAPLFALAAASSVVTFLVQRGGGAMELGDRLPLATRAGNAVTSLFLYLRQTVWPAGLSPLYPYAPVSLPQAGAALVVAAAVTVVVLARIRSRPWLAVGWLWFAGLLVPVCGLIQVGAQSRADRYTYLPLVGVFIAIVWSVPSPATRVGRIAASSTAVAAVALLSGLTLAQERLWGDSVLLWERAVHLEPGDPTIRNNYAHALESSRRFEDSVAEYERAARPERAANVLVRMGRRADALALLQQAASSPRASAAVLLKLGTLLGEDGRTEEAASRLRQAVAANPADAEAHTNLADACDRLGLAAEALAHAREAVRLRPDLPEARFNLALMLQKSGLLDDAIGEYETLVRSGAADASTYHNLGVALQARGRTDEAIAAWREALRLDPTRASTASALAAALARPSPPR